MQKIPLIQINPEGKLDLSKKVSVETPAFSNN